MQRDDQLHNRAELGIRTEHIYHPKSRLNTPVWGSLRSPNNIHMFMWSSRVVIVRSYVTQLVGLCRLY